MIDYSDSGAVSAMRKSRGIEHQDKFKIYGNLNYKPDRTTMSQKLLKQGYRLVFHNGKKYAIKGSEEIECI